MHNWRGCQIVDYDYWASSGQILKISPNGSLAHGNTYLSSKNFFLATVVRIPWYVALLSRQSNSRLWSLRSDFFKRVQNGLLTTQEAYLGPKNFLNLWPLNYQDSQFYNDTGSDKIFFKLLKIVDKILKTIIWALKKFVKYSARS